MNKYDENTQILFPNSDFSSIKWIGPESQVEKMEELKKKIHHKKNKLKKMKKKKGKKGKKSKMKKEIKEVKYQISDLENRLLQLSYCQDRFYSELMKQSAAYLYLCLNQNPASMSHGYSSTPMWNEKLQKMLPQILGFACGTLASNILTGKGQLKLPFGK